MDDIDKNLPKMPSGKKYNKAGRAVLQTLGSIPFAGGLFSAMAGAWSEKEQERVNEFFEHWLKMISDEIDEKEKTIIEIMARLDMQDESVSRRVSSKEYQSLVKKTFREWSAAESSDKRVFIRNILANAAISDVTSDDVLKLFIDWIGAYSELHFKVIAAIYNSDGISRGEIWGKIGKREVRENSADADLFKLIFRDLSTGGLIRQHRETDSQGNFIAKIPQRRAKVSGRKPPVSAFDREEGYELTQLGQQFVHYAMTEVSLKIDYKE